MSSAGAHLRILDGIVGWDGGTLRAAVAAVTELIEARSCVSSGSRIGRCSS